MRCISCVCTEVSSDPSHVIGATSVVLHENLSFEETSIRILAREEKKLRKRSIPYIKVQWSNHEEREVTWKFESKMREHYPDLFLIDMS